MPEGPSIVILREQLDRFIGKEVIDVGGNAKIDLERLKGLKVLDFKSWGKHFLICFRDFTVRIHFMMFGSYAIDGAKKARLRLGLTFPNGVLNMYTADVRIWEGTADENYDWSSDVMSRHWSRKKAKSKLMEIPDTQVGDALLDQNVFSGVGNIIRNEVLHRIKVHPESKTGKLPKTKIDALLKEVSAYAFDFLRWKKEGTLKRQWQAYHRKECGRCGHPIHKKETGKTRRASFFCERCQKKY